ncbi:MAG: hypothetical protein DLM69_00915 [Candidatus Chloroheliales bacterium]|nr:MAG: hypothetical protein DLM69_00915 [Chloroflexota bacterium]
MSPAEKIAFIQAQFAADNYEYSGHADRNLDKRGITDAEILEAATNAQIVEDYPNDPRGASCLIAGYSNKSRPLHILCTVTRPKMLVITLYEPDPAEFITPTQRRQQ